MFTIRQLSLSLILLSLISVSVAAQTQPRQQPAITKTNIIIEPQLVRFTTPGEAVEWHLLVTNQQEEVIFDSGSVYGTTLDWPLKNQQDEAVQGGLYAYTLTTKAATDEAPRTQRGHLIVARASSNDRVWLTSTQPVGIGADSAAPQVTVSGSRDATVGGAELLSDAPRREINGERSALQRDSAGRSVVEQAEPAQKHSAGGLGPTVKTNIPDDLTVNGNFIFTPPSQGFTRDITMQNNNFGLRFFGAPSLSNSPAAAAIQFWGNNNQFFPGQLYLDAGAHDNGALIFRTAPTGGTIAERMRITSMGDVLMANKWRTETTSVNSPPVTGPPNLIGGFLGTGSGGATPGNRATAGVVGGTIGGGGFNGNLNFPTFISANGDNSNRVTDWFGTVGGGFGNVAGNDSGALDDAYFATVGGGQFNTASGAIATVSGGGNNIASGGAAAVGGGGFNFANGNFATVPGGGLNTAQGDYSFAAGNRAKANHQGAFVWADSTNVDFASTGNDQFLIRAAGGVGIGTNSPGYQLDVAGMGRFQGKQAGATSGAGVEIQYGNVGGTNRGIIFAFDRTAIFGGARDLLLNHPGGNVGIGTTSPDQTLTVNGGADKPGGGSWGTFSDERLKNIRGRFTPGLKAVMQLRPLRYEYKADNALGLKASGEHIGFSAQAVQAILPEAVTQNDQGYLLVNNDPILWTMLNAIKEQQQEIAQLKVQIRRLQAGARRRSVRR